MCGGVITKMQIDILHKRKGGVKKGRRNDGPEYWCRSWFGREIVLQLAQAGESMEVDIVNGPRNRVDLDLCSSNKTGEVGLEERLQ